MSGIIMLQKDHPIRQSVVSDEDQLVSEKIAAYTNWVKDCREHGFEPVGDPTVVMDAALFPYPGCYTHTITVAGWVRVKMTWEPSIYGDLPLLDAV